MIKKGLVIRGPGKQGKYYPTSEYRGPIMTADILSKLSAGMILENDNLQMNSPFFKNIESENSLDLTLFDFSNKVGAIITYLLIQSMNPENKIAGNATNDEEKDLNVERWIYDAISSLGYVLLPLFKQQVRVPLTIASLQDNLVDNDYSSIEEKAALQFLADIRDKPQYAMKQKLISELMGSFSNSYPNIARELHHFEHVKRRHIQQNKCKHNYKPLLNKVVVAKSKNYNRRYEHCRKCHK